MAAVDWPTLSATLSAIDADGALTAQQKAYQKANAKCTAIVKACLAFHAFPWQAYSFSKSGVTWTATLTKVAVLRATGSGGFVEDATGNCLGLWLSATKNGVAVRWKTPPAPCTDTNGVSEPVPFIWQNPPALISDGSGTITSPSGITGCAFDLKAMAQSLVNGNILRAAR